MVSAMKEANYQKLIEKLEGEVKQALQQQQAAEQSLKIKIRDFQDRSGVLENELFQLRSQMAHEAESSRQRLAQSQQEAAALRESAEAGAARQDLESHLAALRAELGLQEARRARAEELQQQAEKQCDALGRLADDLRAENPAARAQRAERDAVEIENRELRAACGAMQEQLRAQGEELARLGSREERARREALERSAFLERSLRSTQEELQVRAAAAAAPAPPIPGAPSPAPLTPPHGCRREPVATAERRGVS